jgi:hypothetical protein
MPVRFSSTCTRYVLIAHGSDVETVHAREIISQTNPEAMQEHQPACATKSEVCAVTF